MLRCLDRSPEDGVKLGVMAVLTTDILLEGVRREPAFEWLAAPANHARILRDTFPQVTEQGPWQFELGFQAPPGRARTMGYRFKARDDSHGGRRVLIETTGKRTAGELHYSLRTMKPSSNTLVTLRIDYAPGNVLGQLVDAVALRAVLETGMRAMLQNLKAAIEADRPE